MNFLTENNIKQYEDLISRHESSLILYEAAVKELKNARLTKFPDLTTLQKEYSALQKKKDAIYSDYGKLKRKIKEDQRIKQNVDTILQRKNPSNGCRSGHGIRQK